MEYCSLIRDNAAGLLGELDQFHRDLLSTVALAAEAELLARLRPDVDPAACSDSLVIAGTLLTVSAMREMERPEVSELDAGTMRLYFGEGASSMNALAHRLMAPWYADGFAFCGVAT